MELNGLILVLRALDTVCRRHVARFSESWSRILADMPQVG